MNNLKIKKVEKDIPKDEVEIDKPAKVKGIKTEGNDPNKNIPTSVNFKIPKTLKEQRAKNLAKRSTLPSSSTIGGTDYLLPYKSTEQIFAPVDLSRGIPDYQEREAFIDANGSKMVSLLDKNKYGIFFENDLYDLATFKEQKYNRKVKEFIDELDENQGFLNYTVNSMTKFGGKLALNVSSLVPLVYGMGKALVEWDSSKIFDHGMFDAWEYMESGLERQLPVYGGSNVWKTKNGMLELDEEGNPIRKEFLSRFISDPIKTLDRDVSPAATFVAGAVITELISVPLGAMTGGTAFVANTARIAAQATRLGLKPVNFVRKGMPLIRGLKKLKQPSADAKLFLMSHKYQQTIRLGIAAVRTSGYESSLIARSTQHRTLQKFLEDYHIANGGKVDEHGRVVGDLIEPSESELAKFERLAADAGVIAWRMNVPLVAGMNFIQMPRMYFKNWRVSGMAARSTQRWRSGGQAIYKGTWKANVDAKKYIKYLGYTYRGAKGGITEAWEEFAQGAMEEGLIDYYSINYGADAAKEKVEFWDAMSKAGNAYAHSIEGRDAMQIGGLMGLLGIRLPIKIVTETGKYKFNLRGTGFGGALSEIRQYRKKIQKARDNAELLQKDETLSKNFENFFRHTQLQKTLDDAAETGNVKEFKDAEHASFFSAIYNRESLGLGETVLQDLEGTKNMSLEKFNELYGTEAEMFSEESKKEAIAKAEKTIKQTLKGIQEVNIVTQQNSLFIDRVEHATRNVFKAKKNKVPYIKNRERKQILAMAGTSIIEQMSYLYSAALNSLDRSKELQKQIAEETTASFPMEEINKIAAKIATLNTTTKKAEFKNDAKELYKAILQEWKETDPANYNLKIEKVKPLFQDLVKLKIREAEASSLYNALFTTKGLQRFIEFSEELNELYENQTREDLEKKTEENVKNAKSPVIERDEKSENSVFGNSKITNVEVDKSTRKALKEYKELNKELENEDFATLQKATLELLDKHPGFFALVKKRLEEKGLDLEGIKSVDGIKVKQEERNTEYLGSFLEQIEELRQELNEIEKIDPERAHLHSFAARSQPTREGQEQSTEQDESLTDTVDDMFSGEKVGATHVIIQTHDKQFDSDKKPVIDSLTGKPVDDRVKEQDDYYVIDTAKINDPTFLPNVVLKEESSPQYAIFRINNENPFNLQATVDNIIIDVYHKNSETGEETFIGNLNRVIPGNPAWLLQLRQDIFNQETNKEEDVSEIAPTNAKRTNELVEKAEKVKQELKATTKTEQELKALKEEKSTLESQIESETKEEAPTDIEAKKAKIKRREKQYKDTQEKVDRKYQEENWTEEEKEWNKTAGEQVIEGDKIDLGIKVDERTDKSKEGVRVITNVVKKGTSKTRQKVDVTQFDSQEAADQWAKEKAEKDLALHQKNLSKIESETKEEASDVESKKADIEKRRQEELENKVEELKEKDKSFRSEDGSVPKENITAWTQNKKDIQEAEKNAKRGNLKKGSNVVIKKRTKEGGEVLTGKEVLKEEAKIESLIQEVLNGKKTAKEIIQEISSTYAFFSNELEAIKNYINDRTTNAPEVGNNKQSFPAWRKGEYDIQSTQQEPTVSKEELEIKKADIEAKYDKIIEDEGLNILAPISIDEEGLSNSEAEVKALEAKRDKELDEDSSFGNIKHGDYYELSVPDSSTVMRLNLDFSFKESGSWGKDDKRSYRGVEGAVWETTTNEDGTIFKNENDYEKTAKEAKRIIKAKEDIKAQTTEKYNKLIAEARAQQQTSEQEIQDVKKKQEEQKQRDKRLEELEKQKQVELAALETKPAEQTKLKEKLSEIKTEIKTLKVILTSEKAKKQTIKRKEKIAVTKKDIKSLEDSKKEILNQIEILEPAVEPKKESVVDKKVTERISEINKEITKITKKLEKTNIQKLKDNLAELNRELQELSQALEIKVDLKIDPAFSEIAELEAVEADMTAKQKKTKNKELDDKFGKDKVQRIKTINENFDNIIAQIGQRKINMFFKEGEQIHCK